MVRWTKKQTWVLTALCLCVNGLPAQARQALIQCRTVAVMGLNATESRLAETMKEAGFHHDHIMRTMHRLRVAKTELNLLSGDLEQIQKILSRHSYLPADDVAMIIKNHSDINGMHLVDTAGQGGSAILVKDRGDIAEKFNHEAIHSRLLHSVPAGKRSRLAIHEENGRVSSTGQLVQELLAYSYQGPVGKSTKPFPTQILFNTLLESGYRHHWEAGGEDFIRILFLATKEQKVSKVGELKARTVWKIAKRAERARLHAVDRAPGFAEFRAKIWSRVRGAP